MTKKSSTLGGKAPPKGKKTAKAKPAHPPVAPVAKNAMKRKKADLTRESSALERQLAQRESELAIINVVQSALAAELDIQSIYEVVGEKVRDIFDANTIVLATFDQEQGLMNRRYTFEKGERYHVGLTPIAPAWAEFIRRGVTTVISNGVEFLKRVDPQFVPPAGVTPKSFVTVPLMTKGKLTGAISIQNVDRENAFSESDVRLLETLANSMSVALESARLFDEAQRLLKETEERNAELAIINSVQAALAAELNIQGIYEAVGDKIRAIFHNTDMNIRIQDPQTGMTLYPYMYENGERVFLEPQPLREEGFTAYVLRTRETVVVNENLNEEEKKYGSFTIPGTESEKSVVFVPLVVGDQARGLINLASMEEHVFSESDVRLLQTLANSMSVALENARLFDETQRLLKITEERNAELAIINSVQQGLASKLDMQAIYDLVGDKIREIFDAHTVFIVAYDRATKLRHFPYLKENGKRIYPEPRSLYGLSGRVIETGSPLMINSNMGEQMAATGSLPLDGELSKQSWLGVPIMAGNQVGGVIVLEDIKENSFNESDLRLLQTLASAMSVSLENARLFDETQRLFKAEQERVAELAIINSVQEGLASKLDIQFIIDLIGDKLGEIFDDMDVVQINLYDESSGLIYIPYCMEQGERHQHEAREAWGFRKHVIESRQPLIINENESSISKQYDNPVIAGEQPKSLAFVPLITGDKVRGLITLQNIKRENAFPQSTVQLLATLANSMSVALENARLFDETQRLLKETEDRAAELQIINRVGEDMSRRLDVNAIARTVGDNVTKIFNADATSILVYDEKNEMIVPIFEWDEGNYVEVVEPFPFGKGLTSRVVRSRKALVLGSADEAAQYGVYYPPEAAAINPTVTQSYLGVPIIVGEKVLGVVSVNTYAKNAYTDDSVRLLSTLANNMGVALENANLFDETQRLLNETEERNAELAIINDIGQTLTQEMDLQSLIDQVGDKLRTALKTGNIGIGLYNNDTRLLTSAYVYKNNERVYPEPAPLNAFSVRLARQGRSLVLNDVTQEMWEKFGSNLTFGNDIPKSVIMIPILAGGELIGGITLQDFKNANAFSPSLVRLLETLSSNMGTAIQNARLFDETQRLLKETEQRAAELSIINDIGEALTSTLDTKTLTYKVGDKIREIFNAEIADIMMFDSKTRMVQLVYSYYGKYFENEPPWVLDEGGLTTRIITSRQPLLLISAQEINDSGAQAYLTADDNEDETQSYMGVPIMIGDNVLGVVDAQSARANAFDEKDLRLLQTLASNMGIALENARLFNETNRLLSETEQRAGELSAISTVSQALVVETELDNMIQLIGSQTREIFKADIAYLALLDRRVGIINFPYAYGDADLKQFKFGEGLTSYIIESGEPLLINRDIDGRSIQLRTQRVGKKALSYLGVPIKAGGETIGVLSVQSTKEEGVFNNDHLRLLATIAANAGAAIHTAQLHAETQRRAKETAVLLEISRDISSSLEASVVLQGIVTHARDLLKGDLSALFLPEGNGKVFRAIAAVGDEAESVRNDTINLGEGILGSIAKNKIGEIVNHVDVDPRALIISGTDSSPDEHLLAVPLLADDQLKGLMSVWRTGKELEFTEFELEFLNNLARQAVIAVQNAQMFSESRELRIAAEQANSAKSAFMANMSHELRTPLNAIIGFTRIVRRKAEGTLPEKQTENLDKVLSSAEHLLGLINTVLDIAKIEAGRMDVQAANFNINALMDQCANLAAPLLKPSVTLEKNIGEQSLIIHSDQDKIKQIVLNLLSNAAKFTHEGRIMLGVERVDGAQVHVYVKDSGIGISEEALGRIFEEFQQADTSTTRQYGGTGLGLAISRNLARLLGGDLTASSDPGKGSTFTLAIPIRYGSRPAQSLTPDPTQGQPDSVRDGGTQLQAQSSKKRVLVIDDDPDAVYLLQENLDQNEFEITGSRTGYEGLAIAREQTPHAILLDVLMPETDGWQILHDLKADPATTNIPVVLLTIVDKKALGFRLGAAAYLLKPLDPAVVMDTLHRITGQASRSQRRVLVVDDDPHVADMLHQILPESEFTLASALDGVEGLESIRKDRPDVVLLDLMMPRLDGFGVIEQLRADPETRNLPVIVVSAKELSDDESKKLKESVAFVMRKQGFDGEKLTQEINSILKESR